VTPFIQMKTVYNISMISKNWYESQNSLFDDNFLKFLF